MTYLYAHFLEEQDFARQAGMTVPELARHIDARICPDASYRVDAVVTARSFVARHQDRQTLRFHLTHHLRWLDQLHLLGITREAAARHHFLARYAEARRAFLTAPLGDRLMAAAPQVMDGFDRTRQEATWGHFLDGVYGVCTRDGQPETIFLKQAGVDFITALMAEEITPDRRALLVETVAMLDQVESDFAPHEVAQSSRQRCILDVRRALGLS